jgi:hypothetical protein
MTLLSDQRMEQNDQATKSNGMKSNLFLKMFHVEHLGCTQQVIHICLKDKLCISGLYLDSRITLWYSIVIAQTNNVKNRKISER